MTSTSLYMQFDPRPAHSTDAARYDASYCLDIDRTSETSSQQSGDEQEEEEEGSVDGSVSAGGYATTPVLHGKGSSDTTSGGGVYIAFEGSEDSLRQAPKVAKTSSSHSDAKRPVSPGAASSSSQPLSPGHRQWNHEHQTLAKGAQWYRSYPQLAALTQQFQETAFTYGRLIISERALAPEHRSIKPIDIGGVAGGDKYVHNGILFKFATDPVVAQVKGKPIYLFGGSQPNDEKAIKAMSRELLGADRYWGSFQDLLHYPLMCLIDHKGFRLLAMAVLPISHDTIVYGSDDGGRTVHTDDEKVNAVMKVVGERLNLKGHYVGLNEQHFVYGAGDVEVHLGTDGLYYVVDFARCSAPEAPPDHGDRRTVFSKLLRPEFTRTYKKPLCADAFSRWDASREDAIVHARDVVEATQYLYDTVIPGVARRIMNETSALNVSFDISEQLTAAGGHPKHNYQFDPNYPLLNESELPIHESDTTRVDELDDDLDACVYNSHEPRSIGRRVSRLVSEQLDMLGDIVSSHRLHKEGINMRHLGRVRAATTCPTARTLILSVCVARVLKMQLNERLRDQMRTLSLPADMPFKAVTCQFVAMVMRGFAGDQHFDTKQSRYFWRDELKRELKTRFEHCLNETESAEDFDLRQSVSYKLVYSVFIALTGLQIAEKALTHLWKSETTSFALNGYDILDTGSTWQSTQTYYMSAGVSTLLYAMETDESDGNRTVRRMLRTAFDQLRMSWQRATEGGFPLFMMAVTVSELAIRKRRRGRRNAEWRRAELWWNRAETVWPIHHVFRLHQRCLRNFRERVTADIVQLERRLADATTPLQPAAIKGAYERAVTYREEKNRDEKRRESEPAIKRSTSATSVSPLSLSSSTSPLPTSPAHENGSTSSSSTVSMPPPSPMHGVFVRSDSNVIPFEAYVRPRRSRESKTAAQAAACNVTATIVALEEERDVLRRTDEEIARCGAKMEAIPPQQHAIIKAFNFIDSALDRSVCTILPAGNFATNTRARKHYE